MSVEKKLPIFLGEGDDQIQIGEATVADWTRKPEYTQVLMGIDIFPGEIATLARIVKWDEIVQVSRARYPKKRKFKVDDMVGVCEPLSVWQGYEGKIVTVMPNHYRVMFAGVEGYSIFTEDELTEPI